MIKQILLADDDDDDRMFFEEALNEYSSGNFKLISVSNGEEVLDYLDSSGPADLPDLIVLDQNMPLLSGKETLIQIKTSPRFADIPVIMYSTYNDKSFIRECQSLGIVSVLSKPDSFEGYIEMVNDILHYAADDLKAPLPVR